MSYASIIDLKKRISDAKLIQLTDFADAGQIDEGKVAAALKYGASTIYSYAGRPPASLVTTDQIKDLELTIAIHKLYEGRQIENQVVRQAYEDAIAFLKLVANGTVTLDGQGTLQIAEGGVVIKDHDEDPDAFDDNRLEDYMG